MTPSEKHALEDAVAAVRRHTDASPRVGMILGSGFGSFVQDLDPGATIPFHELTGFPRTTVDGHRGRLHVSACAGVPVVVQQGRYHLYEGYSGFQVSYPVRLMAELGVETLVVTNAAGGLHADWAAGTLMLIEDHVNFQFRSPLRGRGAWINESRFVDLMEPYCHTLIETAEAVGLEMGLVCRKGTYFGVTGPNYETPGEVRMIRGLGGDAVGMSTVQEVIAAKQLGMRVLGLSCISNPAAGLLGTKLNHAEVLEAVAEQESALRSYLRALLPRI